MPRFHPGARPARALCGGLDRHHARAAGYHAGRGGILGGRGLSRHHALPGLLEQIPRSDGKNDQGAGLGCLRPALLGRIERGQDHGQVRRQAGQAGRPDHHSPLGGPRPAEGRPGDGTLRRQQGQLPGSWQNAAPLPAATSQNCPSACSANASATRAGASGRCAGEKTPCRSKPRSTRRRAWGTAR